MKQKLRLGEVNKLSKKMAESDLNPDVTESKAYSLPLTENIFPSRIPKLRLC